MYCPYLRGRQNEILALYDLVSNDLMSNTIIPIIEPIKITSTLIKMLKIFCEKKRDIMLIINPEVGEVEYKDILNGEIYNLIKNDNIIKTIIINSNAKKVLSSDNKNNLMTIGRVATINKAKDTGDIFQSVNDKYNLIINIFPDENYYTRQFKTFKNNCMLADRFNRLNRNVDYKDNADEFFSDDHLYYNDYKYIGFSDYSIIGQDFIESGFAPFAIAVHLVYFDDGMNLRIHHFVSKSNEDSQNPAKKFGECLHNIFDESTIKFDNTFGYKTLRDCYNNGTYPGLGIIKKLSIMHHIESMSKFLTEGNN